MRGVEVCEIVFPVGVAWYPDAGKRQLQQALLVDTAGYGFGKAAGIHVVAALYEDDPTGCSRVGEQAAERNDSMVLRKVRHQLPAEQHHGFAERPASGSRRTLPILIS